MIHWYKKTLRQAGFSLSGASGAIALVASPLTYVGCI
jgi:hypothetical protein